MKKTWVHAREWDIACLLQAQMWHSCGYFAFLFKYTLVLVFIFA